MEASKLKEILEQHRLWLETNEVQGERANLEGADLKGANLKGAILTGTILEKKAEKAEKAEKQTEVASVKSEISIRSEFEALAKKFGLQITCLEFKLI